MMNKKIHQNITKTESFTITPAYSDLNPKPKAKPNT